MYMRELVDTLSDIINNIKEKVLSVLIDFYNILKDFLLVQLKWVTITVVVLINLFGFLVTYENTYASVLFYPDRSLTKLVAERRKIVKSKNKTARIENTVEELLLGPVDPEIKTFFPEGTKLLGLKKIENVLHLNFNRTMIMDLEWDKNNGISIYYILLQSIVNTVCYQFREINKIKFYFNNKEFRYIGDYGPLENGIEPDWQMLKQ